MDAATRRLLGRAEAVAADPALQALLTRALGNEKLQQQLRKDPTEALAAAGVKLPRGLDIKFSPQPRTTPPRLPERPGPDWFPISIRLTRCRTYWVLDRSVTPPKWKQETVCFGFEITRHPPPGGPIG
jgi:hypothetical protein